MDHPQNQPYDGFDASRALFVGLGSSAVCYYRVLLPAHALGADYVGLVGEPPDTRFTTGLVQGQSVMPDFTDYELVVLQQPKGNGWLEVIRALRANGTVVVYEVDDWLHAIKNSPDHDFREHFQNRHLAEYEKCMKACDAMIVSTKFLATAYRSFNRRVFVCENGIDLARYDLTRPQRPTVNIGWAGGTGHARSIEPWLQATAEVMAERPSTTFVSIGQRFADAFKPHFGDTRAIATPFAAIEQYPAAMTMLDVALAPAGKGGFFKGKSDLRWLEAGALGIPIIASPSVYPYIEHGRTGFHANSPAEVKRLLGQLVDDPMLRTVVGDAARDYVRSQRSMKAMSDQWRDVFDALVD